jgi:hypothetical protein
MKTQPVHPEDQRSPRFKTSIETGLLVDRIKRMQPGEVVTYKECNKLTGQDVQGDARHLLTSARHICQNNYQVVTDAVRGLGLRRASDIELTNSGLRIFTGLRRAAKRGVDRMTSIDKWHELPDEDKIRHNATVSGLQLIRTMSKPKNIDRIAGAVNTEVTGVLPIARTLELFRGPRKV